MNKYQTSLDESFLKKHSKRLNISLDDIRLAEMIIVDSLTIDFSSDLLLSFEALNLIPKDQIRRYYHNAFVMMNLKYDYHKKLWFDFIYKIHLEYDLRFINNQDLIALSPQDETEKIASNIIETWLEIDENIDFDNRIGNDTLHQLIKLQVEFENSNEKKLSDSILESITRILESQMMKTYMNEDETDSSHYLMLDYFIELCMMNKSKTIQSIFDE